MDNNEELDMTVQNSEPEEAMETVETPEPVETDDEALAQAPKAYKGSGLMTFAGAIAGVLVGLIPLAAWTYITGKNGWVLYTVVPVCVALFIALFGGWRDKKGMAVTAVFGVLGAFWGAIVVYTAKFLTFIEMSPLLIYPMSFSLVRQSNVFDSFTLSSATIFPVIFVILGILIGWVLLGWKKSEKTE